MSSYVFLDPKGRRWVCFLACAVVLGAVFLSGIVLFVYSLGVDPVIWPPKKTADIMSAIKATEPAADAVTLPPSPPGWLLAAKKRPGAGGSTGPSDRPVSLGFYVDWDPACFRSLQAHADRLTHLSPEWFVIDDVYGNIRSEADPKIADFARSRGITLIPLLTNLGGDGWQPEAVEELARRGPQGWRAFGEELGGILTKTGAGGVLIDWEDCDPAYREEIVGLLESIGTVLKARGLETWMTVPMGDSIRIFDLDRLSNSMDRFVALLYDESEEPDRSVPTASHLWYTEWLDALMEHGRPGQWIAGIGAFGLDCTGQGCETIGFSDAMARAGAAHNVQIQSSAPHYQPRYWYEDTGGRHNVWMLDAVTFRNQRSEAMKRGAGGVALYRIGLEDPQVWDVIREDPPVEEIQAMPPGMELAHAGRGDLVAVRMEQSAGHRRILPGTQGIWTVRYEVFPRGPTIFHYGANPRKVVLTFDDGPDPDYTPAILDILKEKQVPAVFFVVGSRATEHPELIRRIWEEGHEIGNHSFTHPDLSRASAGRIDLELNATQRVIESVTGHSTTIFRPPFHADSRPRLIEHCTALLAAQRLGYLNVAESVDPQDWEKPGAEEILQRVKDRISSGNLILLHDGGGDRSQTVDALAGIIDYLTARGSQIASLSDLVGTGPEQLMPPAPMTEKEEAVSEEVAKTGFNILMVLQDFTVLFMVGSTVLVILRLIFVTLLAIEHKRRRVLPVPEGRAEPVSVIIAAFNEERVIGSTLRSVLNSRYAADLEVLVVDDGSTDRTAAVIEDMALSDARVRLIRQPNLGKARALNRAVKACRNEVVVTLDADTQLGPDSIRHLAAALRREGVGAVSGNIRVGNPISWITRFQALEYVCGFNLDRRAYDVLDCVTVVPGAASALRRSAVLAAGGISGETLAEDTDLTLALQEEGWKIRYAPEAMAWTEAPSTLRTLARQRVRWAFGTLQCVWKHGHMLFNPRYGALGLFSLPNIVFFQMLLVALIPAIDLFLLLSLFLGTGGTLAGYVALFMVAELLAAAVACLLERENLLRALLIVPMRFFYRPLLSYAVWVSLLRALRGSWFRWHKAERSGTVLPERARTAVR